MHDSTPPLGWPPRENTSQSITGMGLDRPDDDAIRRSGELVHHVAGLADTLTAMQHAQDYALFVDPHGMPYRSLNQATRNVLAGPAAARTWYSQRTGLPLPKLRIATWRRHLAVGLLIPTGSDLPPTRGGDA